MADIVKIEMKLTALFITLVCTIGCSTHESDLQPLRTRIPPADRAKYQRIVDAADWRNPKLIVVAEGAEIIGITRSGQPVPIESVPELLANLPKSAWPYGLVVEMNEAGLRNPGDTPKITANRQKLVRLLENLGVKVELWPSA